MKERPLRKISRERARSVLAILPVVLKHNLSFPPAARERHYQELLMSVIPLPDNLAEVMSIPKEKVEPMKRKAEIAVQKEKARIQKKLRSLIG